jgi:hemoglobin
MARGTKDREEVRAMWTEMRRVVVAACFAAAASGSAQAQATGAGAPPAVPLYERLGGLRGITAVVDDFIDRLVRNKTLNRNPEIDAGRKRSPPPYLKYQVSALVCEVTGGPCKYGGKGMKEAHAQMKITEKEWDVMVAEFKKSLAKYKVPAKEQQELLDIVGKTKPDIVAGSTASR